jgi:Leucine-rich repeat (LRR) protein
MRPTSGPKRGALQWQVLRLPTPSLSSHHLEFLPAWRIKLLRKSLMAWSSWAGISSQTRCVALRSHKKCLSRSRFCSPPLLPSLAFKGSQWLARRYVLSYLVQWHALAEHLTAVRDSSSQIMTVADVATASTALTDLQLRSNAKLESIQDAFFDNYGARSLQRLIIHDCPKLASLSERIESCVGLESLCVSQCRLSALPDAVCCLGRLHTLRAFGNVLRVLPAYWSLVYLTELDLGNNDLSELPDGLCSCRQLRHLKVQVRTPAVFSSVFTRIDLYQQPYEHLH